MEVEVSRVDNLCRICSEKSNGIAIYSPEGRDKGLEDKIKKFLYITVGECDGLPQRLCDDCCSQLEAIHRLAELGAETQVKLTALLSQGTGGLQSGPTGESSSGEAESEKGVSSGVRPPPAESLSSPGDSVKGSLLHSILTKDKWKGSEREGVSEEPAVTELEVTVDPMLFLTELSEAEEEEEDYDEAGGGACSRSSSTSSSRSPVHSYSEGTEERGLGNTGGSQMVGEGKPYQCTVCPRGFNSDLSLKNHLWGHLSMRKILASSDLHLNRLGVEKGGRGLSTGQCLCTVCGRVYPTRSTLRAHQITHSNLRPHKCSLCEKTFKRNQDLKFHINQHTGERPYRCPYCPKAFASSGNCFSHRKRMHPKQLARDKKANASRQFAATRHHSPAAAAAVQL